MRKWTYILVIVLLPLGYPVYAESLSGSAYLQGGYDTIIKAPYAELGGELGLWLFTVDGSVRTDIMEGGRPFKPLRSVYDIGAYIEWGWLRIGYYDECTHFDLYEIEFEYIESWLPLYRPDMNEFYFRITIGG